MLVSLLASNYSAHANKHVIGCQHPAGFFSIFCQVLNHLGWCERNNKTPVVYWDAFCLYYQAQGYQGTHNAWEYYFEPVSNLNYQWGELINRQYFAPDGTGIEWRSYNTYILTYKNWAHDLIKKYIKIKPYINVLVDDFYKKNMAGKKTIAIHLRGTDRFTEVRPVPVNVIIAEANKYKGYQYLVASDENALLDYAKQSLEGNVIYYKCKRSNSNKPLHALPRKNPALGGRDVLVEVLLMSMCDKFICTSSNVSAAVHFFNPSIDSTLLSN